MLQTIAPPTEKEVERASGVSQKAARNWQTYQRHCEMRRDLVERTVRRYREGLLDQGRVLDWGCALGGVALLLSEKYGNTIHCADVDPRSIGWLEKHRPHVEPRHLPFEPRLPYADQYFDLIYGISVFTHIPPGSQAAFLAELARIARHDGLVLLTFTSHWALSKENKVNLKDLPSPEELEREGIVYYRYPDTVLEKIGFDDEYDYGLTYHSHAGIKSLVQPFFRILDIESPALAYQDLIVLTRAYEEGGG